MCACVCKHTHPTMAETTENGLRLKKAKIKHIDTSPEAVHAHRIESTAATFDKVMPPSAAV